MRPTLAECHQCRRRTKRPLHVRPKAPDLCDRCWLQGIAPEIPAVAELARAGHDAWDAIAALHGIGIDPDPDDLGDLHFAAESVAMIARGLAARE